MSATNQTKSLVEGALFAALTAVIALMGLYLPWLFFISSLVTPMPITVMVYRNGLKKGIVSLLVAYILLVLLYSEPLTVSLIIIQYGLLGLVIGLVFKNRVSSAKGIVLTMVISACLTFVLLGIGSAVSGIGLKNIESEFQSGIKETVQLYIHTGLIKESQSQDIYQSMKETLHLITILLPGLLIIGSVLSGMITYLLSRGALKRLNCQVVPLPPFKEWTYPWYTVWSVIIGLSLTLIGDHFQIESVGVLGKNVLYVSAALYFVLGVSIATFYVNRMKISRFMKIILVILLAFWPFTPVFLITLGVMDPLVDIRRLQSKNNVS